MKSLILMCVISMAACSHPIYEPNSVYSQDGPILESVWEQQVIADHPSWKKAVEKSKKAIVRCRDDLGTNVTGRLSINRKVIMILCEEHDVRKTAVLHERHHLLLFYLGHDDWRTHSNPLWAYFNLIEHDMRRISLETNDVIKAVR